MSASEWERMLREARARARIVERGHEEAERQRQRILLRLPWNEEEIRYPVKPPPPAPPVPDPMFAWWEENGHRVQVDGRADKVNNPWVCERCGGETADLQVLEEFRCPG